MKKKVVAFVALMLVSLMIFSIGAKLARADEGPREKGPDVNAKIVSFNRFRRNYGNRVFK